MRAKKTESAVPSAKESIVAKAIKKVYTYFNLDTFEKVEVTKEIPPYVPIADLNEAMTKIDNNNDTLLKAINAYLKRQALRAVKQEVAALGGSTTVVMSLAKPFRAMPPFSLIFERNADGTIKKDKEGENVVDRQEQSKQIFAFLKSNPAIVESIKAASLALAESDDEDGEDDKKEE